MGTWNYKALDNDIVLDAMTWIDSIETDTIPFIMELLLTSERDEYKTLGVVIAVSSKIAPTIDLYTCGTEFHYKTFFCKIYNETKLNKRFRDNIQWFGGWVWTAINELKHNTETRWNDEHIKKDRLNYLNRLNEIYRKGE